MEDRERQISRVEFLCSSAAGFLKAGDYQHGAEALRQALVASERSGARDCACFIEIACDIASACGLCRHEAHWHRRAHDLASERECELLGELIDLLQIAEWHLDPPHKNYALPPAGRPSPSPGLVSYQAALCRESGRDPRGSDPARIESALGRSASTVSRAAAACDSRTAIAGDASLGVYCLGSFRVFHNGVLIEEWSSLKGLAVLKYLVAHHGRKVNRETLMDVFWPEADAVAARRNLHQAIYSLRKSLRGHACDRQYILSHENHYEFNPALALWIDAEEFESHLRNARRCESAARLEEAMQEYGVAESLYQGRFMEDDLYADWADSQRQYLEQAYLEVASHLSALYFERGAPTAAVALCQKVLNFDPCYENAHRQLMLCYIAQGQRYLAVRQFHLCDAALRSRSGLTPSDETIALYRRIAHAS
ncbi:MAG: BTAD domain-containing putative transcriptional regulator [Gammaproteobacteria bacterium]